MLLNKFAACHQSIRIIAVYPYINCNLFQHGMVGKNIQGVTDNSPVSGQGMDHVGILIKTKQPDHGEATAQQQGRDEQTIMN